MKSEPPRLAEWIVRVAASRSLYASSLIGDLREEFANASSRSPQTARWWYWRRSLAIALRYLITRLDTIPSRTPTNEDQSTMILDDLRFAGRTLRRAPVFTAVAVLTIALGVGANTAVFSAVHAVLLAPLAFGDPEGLAAIELKKGNSLSKYQIEVLRERQHAFEGIAAYSRWGASLTGDGEPESLKGAMGSANLFDVLQVRPALGRTFLPGEDSPGATNVVVIGHGLWQRRFAGERGILGKVITLNGRPTTIIGVMPPNFGFPIRGTEFWSPIRFDRGDANDYGAGYLLGVGRLREGVDATRATKDLRRVANELRVAGVAGVGADAEQSAVATPFRDALVGSVGQRLMLLLGAVSLILLITCLNVANLLLARGVSRSQELAVRSSIGASRGRLLQQLLTESILLSSLGGLLGVAVALVFTGVVSALIPQELLGRPGLPLNGPVLAFAFGLSLVVGVAFGVLPALRGTRANATAVLRAGRGLLGAGGAHRLMRGLVVAEFSVALILAVAAGLMVQTSWRLLAEDPGFRADGVLSFRLEPPRGGYLGPARQRAMMSGVLARLAAIPGVTAAGAIHLLPLGDGNWNSRFAVEGRAAANGQTPPEVDWRIVTPDYFRAMEISLVHGRLFTAADRDSAEQVTIINETLARREFGTANAIGKRVRSGFEEPGVWATVVGVVRDTKDQSLAGAAHAQMYRPFDQNPMPGGVIVMRTRQDPLTLIQPARDAVRSIDPRIPLSNVRPMVDVVNASIAEPRMMTALLASLGGLALFLSAVGIYGVISYVVSQRTAELGLRMALGARHGQILRLVLTDALKLAGLGIAAGLPLALLLMRFLSSQLYGVLPSDPATFIAVTILFSIVAVLAASSPARAAARIDPLAAIRGS